MENWTENADIVTIVEYLGYTKCTTEDKIKWLNCHTVERLERTNPEYIPLYHDSRKEPLFIDTISILLDWDKLIKIANDFKMTSVPTNKNEMIKLIAETIIVNKIIKGH